MLPLTDHKAQPLKEPLAVNELGEKEVSESHQIRASGVHQVNADSVLASKLNLGPL